MTNTPKTMAGVSRALKRSCDLMSEQGEISSNSEKEAIEVSPESALVIGDGSCVEEEVQDQVILAPEIMRMILEHLDLRGLKKVRLVCKSWLIEAQIHMERRGIVCLSTQSKSSSIQEFIDMSRMKITALPQPFKSVDVELSLDQKGLHPQANLLANQLSSLCPPLSITRFYPTRLPLNLAFSLIVQFSTSLGDLELYADTCEARYLPRMDPDHIFPELEIVEVQASLQEGVGATGNNFPSIIAWIAKCSPNFNSYCCESTNRHQGTLEMVNELLLKVDIKNVEILKFQHKNLSDAAAEHFKSIPFTQLQYLDLRIYDSTELTAALLMSAVRRVVSTLEGLDFNGIEEIPDDFPICPNVQEIFLLHLRLWNDRCSTIFPSLKTLTLSSINVPNRGQKWEYNTPLRTLKELTVWAHLPKKCICLSGPQDALDAATLSKEDFGFSHSQTIKFFDTFPALESLEIADTFVLHCCRLKASGDPRFSKLLEGVKHLKMGRHCKCWNGVSHASDYSSLAVLKEIESIDVQISEAVPSIPVQKMASLKVIRFSWDDCWKDLDKLLEIASGVERVIITNCCSAPRVLKSDLSKEQLMQFFKSAQNAECGCES